ncbi:hypothetical protein D3C74_439450 [compost metagenome]
MPRVRSESTESACSLLGNGHQFARPNIFTITGTKNGRKSREYRISPLRTTVAICIIERTPDGYIAAKVPLRMTAADRITVPMFFIAYNMASCTFMPLFSLKRSIRKML